MKVICKTCEKVIGDFNKKVNKSKVDVYDDYYFCRNGKCLEIYLEKGVR